MLVNRSPNYDFLIDTPIAGMYRCNVFWNDLCCRGGEIFGGYMKNCLLFGSVLSVACTDVKSSSINTDGMFLNYWVVTEGAETGSSANAMLRVGGVTSTTYVDLEEGDQLVVDVAEESQVLAKQSLGVIHSYSAEYVADTSGSEFVLNFNRVDLDSAPSSVATLPDTFELTAPEADTIISRSDDTAELLITWDNEGTDAMSIEVQGDCFEPYIASDVSDTGTHTVPASYFSDHSYDTMTSCEATVIVERHIVGTLDPAFGEGIVYGAQRRTVSVRVDP